MLLRQIADKLPNGIDDLADHYQALWVLVHVGIDPKDQHISPEIIKIVSAGLYATDC
jgi:hypothetical protein